MWKKLAYTVSAALLIACGSNEEFPLEPQSFDLVFPQNNSLCLDGIVQNDLQSEVRFDWTASKYAAGYELTVVNLNTNESNTYSSDDTREGVVLNHYEPYTWKVTALGENNAMSLESETWKFYLAGEGETSYAPFPAELTSPRPGAMVILVDGQTNLGWTVNDVDNDLRTINVYVDTNSDATTLLQTVDYQQAAQQITASLEPGTLYYWRVEAIDAEGNQSDSGIYTFRTSSATSTGTTGTSSGTTDSSLPNDDFEGNGNITWNSATSGSLDAGFGVNFTTVANPSSSGINTSANVGRYEDTGAQYANMNFDVSPNFDLSTNNVFRVKVYVPTPATPHTAPAQLALKLQDGSLSEPWTSQVEVIQPYQYDTWQELVFDFGAQSGATNFNRIVVQFNGENNYETVEAFMDDFVMTSDGSGSNTGGENATGGGSSSVTDDFEGNGNITWNSATTGEMDAGFGVNFSTVANPDASGINTSANVGRYEDTGEQYSNMNFNVSPNFDLSTNNVFRVKVYVPTPSTPYTAPAQLALKLQNGNLAAPWESQIEVIQQYQYDTWQELVFDFSAQAAATDFNRVVVQFNGENNYETMVGYIDDITLTSDGSTSGGDSSGSGNSGGSTGDSTAAVKSDDFEGNGNITWDSSTTGVNDAGMGVNFSTVANPNASGINTSANVGRYEDTGDAQYAHMIFNNQSNYDLSTRNIVRVKVYVPTPATAHTAPAQLALKLQDGNLSEPWLTQIEVVQSYQYDTWQELVFDFSGQAAATNFNRMIVQFNGEDNFESVIAYFDDFTLGDQ